MSSSGDFVIENGVLTKYVGPGGDVVVPEGVTEIRKSAFAGSEIRSIAMPDSVVGMDAEAFKDCKRLEKARLSDQIARIPDAAFQGCVNLQEVAFPKGLKEIGMNAFQRNSRLGSAVLPEGLLRIRTGAFKDCGGLSKYGPVKEIVLPSTLILIENDAFRCRVERLIYNCDDHTVVWDKAFSGKIHTVVVGEHVQQIPPKTFNCCVDEFHFMSHETKVSEASFRGKGLPDHELPILIRCAYPKQFPLRLRKKAAPLAAEMILSGETLSKEQAEAWRKVIRQNAATLEERLSECQALRTFMLREKMVSRAAAQRLLENTADVDLKLALLEYSDSLNGQETGRDEWDPEHVPSLAELRKTFKIDIRDGRARITGYKSDAAEVVIPAFAGKVPVTEIGDNAFAEQKHLRSVIIPEGVTYIGAYAFDHCPKLSEIAIPESAQKIGAKAFSGMKQLEDEHGLMIIHHNLIDYSGTDTTVVIPDGVETIAGAFWNKKEIEKIQLPQTVVTIGDKAFQYCARLRDITLPNGVREIGKEAFFSCTKLKAIRFSEGLQSVGDEAFVACEGLTELALPDGLVSIGRRAFAFCSSLRHISIPRSVKQIADNAFGEKWELRGLKLTIHAPAGSYAEQFAKENNIPFIAE